MTAITAEALTTAKSDQLRRFQALRGEFAEHYAAARTHEDPELVEPQWAERNAALERAFLPRPPLRFLRHPSILYSMVLSDRYAAAELDYLTSAIEPERLPALLEEDPVGGPPLIAGHDGSYLTSGNLVHHLHHLVRIGAETGADLRSLGRVVEWGGGYGSMARLFLRAHGAAPAYVIVDTPLFTCVQWLFLASVLGAERVELCVTTPVVPQPGRITLIPVSLWRGLPRDADLFVSTWALNESPPAVQDAVAEADWFAARHLLMGMHDGAPLADRAGRDGARIVPVGDFMPAQNYVVR